MKTVELVRGVTGALGAWGAFVLARDAFHLGTGAALGVAAVGWVVVAVVTTLAWFAVLKE